LAAPRQNFNLQLFSGEKTEEATPKRREEARRKGQVAKSVEISAVFGILAAFGAFKVWGGYIYDELTGFMRHGLTDFVTKDLTVADVSVLILNVGYVLANTALPVMLIILVVSLAINYLQVGPVFSSEALLPKLDRLDPLSGLQRIFSKRSLVELFKSLFKVLVVGYFIYRFVAAEFFSLVNTTYADLNNSLSETVGLTFNLAFQIAGVLLLLAILDYWYQWWEYNQSLKMSKQEVKDEYKQTEGNPQIKGKIKERQRALAMRRMMQEVPKADVVVTNPEHFAVAMKYDRSRPAPTVVAKGQNFVAQRIKELAREHSVPVVENKPLARALYYSVEIGDFIPRELYQAVAEVLAYVYRLRRRSS